MKYMNISYYINHSIQGIKNCTLSSICSICIYFLDQMTKYKFSVQNLFARMKLLPEINKIVVMAWIQKAMG